MTTVLSVNLNKIALLRNSRGRGYPNVTDFARRSLDAGAGGITIHPRPDQRHATYRDVAELRRVVDDYPGTELNIEGNPSAEFLSVIMAERPHQCTLVPDAPEQLTSDHGYRFDQDAESLPETLAQLRQNAIRSSVFVDADPSVMPKAAHCGADRIELYTEAYARAAVSGQPEAQLQRYRQAAEAALSAGLGINAGHDLDLDNLEAFARHIPALAEVSIGHALTIEALLQGWDKVIARYLQVLQRASAGK